MDANPSAASPPGERSTADRPESAATRPTGSPLEVLAVATRLGLTSFGGPVAHLGYFREEYVIRRKWVDEATYTDLIALSQFLPGPASSKVGISHLARDAAFWST